MNFVKAKKSLGQHFLKDEVIAAKIVNSLIDTENLLEIGSGMGVLTKYLFKDYQNFKVIEIDNESVMYLKKNYANLDIIHGDFLKIDIIKDVFSSNLSIIGNFPYNISSQILFKIIENKDIVTQVVGMFQKEVAERIASKEGNKIYGILSVLTQAFYDVEYLFSVDENSFIPPPKVKSGVIRLQRKEIKNIICNEKFFFTIVKTAFNQRRKTLKNSLKPFIKNIPLSYEYFLKKRPEELSVEEFIFFSNLLLSQN